MDSLCESERLVLPPLPQNLMLSFWGPRVGSGAFDFTPRDCLGIGSGLSRDWLGSLSQKFRLELERNWFEIVSGFSRDRLGEVGDGFRATFRGPQSSEETSLSEVAWRLEALRYSSLGVLCARSGDSSHSRAALTPQNVHWTFLGAA